MLTLAAHGLHGGVRRRRRLARSPDPWPRPLPKSADAVPVVVDSDLAPDDLVSLAYLLRHPDVEVLAVTVPTTGLVTCPAGVDLATDLMRSRRCRAGAGLVRRDAPRRRTASPFPTLWSMGALTDNGLRRDDADTSTPVEEAPPELIARLAGEHPGLTLVALGPMTEVAATLREEPEGYGRIDRIVAMTGVVEGPPQDDVAGEWNAAADPDSLAEVLAGPVPVTVVPHEVAPARAARGHAGARWSARSGSFTSTADAEVLGPRDGRLPHDALGRPDDHGLVGGRPDRRARTAHPHRRRPAHGRDRPRRRRPGRGVRRGLRRLGHVTATLR